MKLNGYSGCRLEILRTDMNYRVRKSSPSIGYNERLRKQKRKQESLHIGDLKSCLIYDDGYKEGLYYFIMEYINGTTFADYLEKIKLSEIKGTVNKLTSHFTGFTQKNETAKMVFNKKIQNTLISIHNNSIININDKELVEAVELLNTYTWEYVIPSPCHGDMTLENIIVGDDGIYLIDFLDSFYDSWMIDAAKFLQDAMCFWTYRNKTLNINLEVRLLVFKDLCINRILDMRYGKELLNTVYHILLLNMLRILPYTKNEDDYFFLKQAISTINIELRGN